MASSGRLRYLRSIDRKINEARYPYLFYPEVYLLDAGYRTFYTEHPECCDGKYTEMRNLQQSGGIDLNGVDHTGLYLPCPPRGASRPIY